ncbi:MAG: 2-C-methyl-D-erythritol 4-phosphate cytidylyltransferase [Clostridia bacterium]|nr:2-C-methyl-D-erythritol 4-phosphate cytidylyltransferase [Clostridia bacterium]
MTYAIIAAGGQGMRFGADIPKQFTLIDGIPILRMTVDRFEETDEIDKIIIACPEAFREMTEEILTGTAKTAVTEGGATRNDTIMKAIDYIEETDGLDENTVIVTHDAVRPFVTSEIIRESIISAEENGASVAAVEAVDTMIITEDGKTISEVPDRSKIYHVQTPQTFRAMKLRKLYNSLTDEEKASLTDCSKIFLYKNQKVAIIKGDRINIKITYQSDVK